MHNRRASDHIPDPALPGQVVSAPVYVRVRPGWLERALFIAVFIQIILSALFIAFGSAPARVLVSESDVNRLILCDMVAVENPSAHSRYVRHGYCE